jgi:hypothetical protein
MDKKRNWDIFVPECYPQEFLSDGKVSKEHLVEQLKNINVFR